MKPRAAICLTAFARGSTTPTATVYVTGPAAARRLYATVLGPVLLAEQGGGGTVREEHVRVGETGARETRRE